MTTVNYFLYKKGESLSKCYRDFIDDYWDSQKIMSSDESHFDINDVCVYLRKLDEKKVEDSVKRVDLGNLILIGKRNGIEIVADNIKSKGFSLEDISKLEDPMTKILRSLVRE